MDRYLTIVQYTAVYTGVSTAVLYLLARTETAALLDAAHSGQLLWLCSLVYLDLWLLRSDPGRGDRIGRLFPASAALCVVLVPRNEPSIDATWVVAIAWASVLVSLYERYGRSIDDGSILGNRSLPDAGEAFQYAVGLALATGWGAYLVFDELGRHNFFHDERIHAAVVTSLLEVHEFRVWNFIAEVPEEPYSRGYLVNAVGAGLSTVFGFSELTLRFFPALVGVLAVPLVYRFVCRYTDRDVALAATIGYVSNPIVIFFSRFLRPYTVFIFTYLLSLYLLDVAVDGLRTDRRRAAVLALAGVSVSLALAMQASQFAKISIALIPVAFVVYLGYYPSLKRDVLDRPRMTVSALGIAVVLLLGLGVFGEILALPRQVSNFISLSRIDTPTVAYFEYLFRYYVKFDTLFLTLFFAGVGLLLARSVVEREPRGAVFMIYTLVPLLVMIYLFDRFEDPRYVIFLIPFVLAVAMVPLATVARLSTGALGLPSARVPLLVLLVTTLVVYPLSPTGHTGPDEFAMEAPAQWDGGEGRTMLHRRAVPPDYELAYQCLNEIVEPGDAVVISYSSETPYVEPQPGVEYYRLTWQNDTVTNHATGEVTQFFDLIDDGGDVYVMVTYVNMIDESVRSWMIDDATSISAEIGVKRYNYNRLFAEHGLYWPELRHHGPDAPNTDACAG